MRLQLLKRISAFCKFIYQMGKEKGELQRLANASEKGQVGLVMQKYIYF